VAATAVLDADRIYVTGHYPGKELMAIEPRGPNTPRVVWRKTREASRVPSPLVAGQCLFLVSDQGVATCLEAETGNRIWRKRLGGEFSASPLLAGGNVYAASEDGKVFVFPADRKFKLLSQFDLRTPILASPVLCGGQLFIRTVESLVCVSGRQGDARPSTDSASLRLRGEKSD
jgi:outer membrane protein assembly factor BamB